MEGWREGGREGGREGEREGGRAGERREEGRETTLPSLHTPVPLLRKPQRTHYQLFLLIRRFPRTSIPVGVGSGRGPPISRLLLFLLLQVVAGGAVVGRGGTKVARMLVDGRLVIVTGRSDEGGMLVQDKNMLKGTLCQFTCCIPMPGAAIPRVNFDL